jgi:hypothetical protein
MCNRMAVAHELLWPPLRPLLRQLVLLWISMLAMSAAAGMVAVLFEPLWAACLAFALSGVALLSGWGWALPHVALTLLYVLSGVLFATLTQRDLQQRVRFSVRPVGENWRVVMVVLLMMAVASFYLGFAQQVRREGFSLPDQQVDEIATEVAGEVVDATPLSRLEVIRDEGVRQVKRVLRDLLERQLKKVEHHIPPFSAMVLFVLMFVVLSLLWWVPIVILAILFPLLTALGVARRAVETIEVQRLVIG